MPEVKKALDAADGDALAAELERAGKITIQLADGPAELSRRGGRGAAGREARARPPRATASCWWPWTTALTPELEAEGWAREFVHQRAAARKEPDLDYADRIRVRFQADPAMQRGGPSRRRRDWRRDTAGRELGSVGEDACALAEGRR